MLRASSRQRLASSDVFDAAIPEDTSSSSSSSAASSNIADKNNKNKKPELSSEIGATHVNSHHQEEEGGGDIMPADHDHHHTDDDFYSVADYTVDSNLDVHAGRRSSSVVDAGWSFDHSEDDRGPITSDLTNSPSSAARRKRERSERSRTNSTAVSGSSMKKNVSFSALPRFPSLIEENPIPLDEVESSIAVQGHHHPHGMARTPSLLDLLAVKPSGSTVGAMNLSANPTEHLVPLSSASTSNSQQAKTLVIPRVPSKIGLGNRVASDLSLSSTLSRYMSVPSNLCDIAGPSGGGAIDGAGAVTTDKNVADINMTLSTSSSIDGNYSPSSQSQGALDLSMDSSDANANANVLPGDALCNVASFLATSELRDLSTTNADLRVHFAGPSGKHLWVDHATRRWPSILQPEEEDGGIVAEGRHGGDNGTGTRVNRFDDKVVEIVDRIGLATAGLGTAVDTATLIKSSAQNEVSNHLQQQPNLSALLGLAAKDCPTSMSPCPMPSASEVPGRQRRIRSGEEFAVVRVLENSVNVSSAVQFTARVGEGDRSITSDAPLPRPLPPPRKNIGGEFSRTAGNDSGNADSTIKSNNGSNRWSPRLPPISPTQTLITFLRSASRVSSRGDGDEDDTSANGRLGKLRPFVCPYVASEDADKTVIDMTPRLVAYYEVKILPRDAIDERSNPQEDAQAAAAIREGFAPPATGVTTARGNSHHHHRRGVLPQGPEMPPLLRLPGPALGGAPIPAVPLPRNLPPPRHVLGGQQHGIGGGPGDDNANDGNNEESLDAECVAIGLSTSRFRPAAKMPGWDAHSFGYHSDDGGIFHGAGDMERQYGSTYGVGDTVGCGIDYSFGEGGGSIFFTLNGKFLGYAWTNVAAISLGEDMYPTVGVDTNCPLEINFGSRPFAFDLGSFVEDQRQCIERALGPLAPSASVSREKECESDEDDMGRYLDHGLGETRLFSSSKIDEWGSLEPMTSPQGGNAAASVFGGEKINRGSGERRFSNSGGGSVLRPTRARSGGLRRPRMFRGHA